MALDHAAFTAFAEQYQPLVFRSAIGLVGDRDEAEDIVQEVFVLLYEKMGSYRGDGSIEGWIYRITRRVAERRRSKVQRRLRLGALPAARPTAEVYVTDPGARVDRERAMSLVHDAVLALPQRQREIFDLCDLQGRSPAEVANMLELNPASVRASLFKARASVRRTILATHPRDMEPAP